jgi:hypothetical protein
VSKGQGEAELIAVESAMGLADDYGGEAAPGVEKGGQQSVGRGAALPRQ